MQNIIWIKKKKKNLSNSKFSTTSYNGNFELYSFDVFLQKSAGGACTKIESKQFLVF
jgi:hypothetical protein